MFVWRLCHGKTGKIKCNAIDLTDHVRGGLHATTTAIRTLALCSGCPGRYRAMRLLDRTEIVPHPAFPLFGSFVDHALNSLLLVYPAPGDTALRGMREYRGDALVYVGEGRGGANASDEFFDCLDAEWDVTNIVDLDPFPQCFERLYVLRRRKQEGVASSPNEAAAAGRPGNVPVP